jgi:hypothetical protein
MESYGNARFFGDGEGVSSYGPRGTVMLAPDLAVRPARRPRELPFASARSEADVAARNGES